jgi:(R,R)-butanediol dehydrogenase/meso-butanediol dehydrogenase/diacetyl reductase
LVAVPAYTVVPVGDAVSDEAAALTEPLAVALHALDRGGFRPAEDVLVVGFGPIGAAAAVLARALGGRPIVAETSVERLAVAERQGYEVVESTAELPRELRRRLGSGGAALVVDATGVAAVLPLAIECTRRGGRIVLAGLTGTPSPIEGRRLALFERSLIGSLGYRNDLPRVMKLMDAGALDAEALITAVVPLTEASDTVRDLAADPGGRVKVLVDLRAEEWNATG